MELLLLKTLLSAKEQYHALSAWDSGDPPYGRSSREVPLWTMSCGVNQKALAQVLLVTRPRDTQVRPDDSIPGNSSCLLRQLL